MCTPGPTGPLGVIVISLFYFWCVLPVPVVPVLFLLLLPAAPGVAQTVGVTPNGPSHNGNR
jgi:hypothetical protein